MRLVYASGTAKSVPIIAKMRPKEIDAAKGP